MRVFTATLATETNTFSPIPTGMSIFKDTFFFPAGQHPDRPALFTGPLWAARQRAKERPEAGREQCHRGIHERRKICTVPLAAGLSKPARGTESAGGVPQASGPSAGSARQ